ncbi:unnamed protein product, partial [Tetraodon nigroviridis]
CWVSSTQEKDKCSTPPFPQPVYPALSKAIAVTIPSSLCSVAVSLPIRPSCHSAVVRKDLSGGCCRSAEKWSTRHTSYKWHEKLTTHPFFLTVQINGLKEIYLKLSGSVGANSQAIPHDLPPDPLFSGVTCRLPLVGVWCSHALNDNV